MHSMPIKWKLYRVANYLLLCLSIIISIFILRIPINARNTYDLVMSLLFGFLFLFMAVYSLVNITIMTKTFPDKLMRRSINRWHVFSIVLNLFSVTGLLIVCISLLNEIIKDYFEGLLIMLIILLIFLIITSYVLLCQFTLNRYLRRRNTSLMNSLIDSIGNNTGTND